MRFEAFDMGNWEHVGWVKRVINPTFTEDTRGIMAIRDDESIAGAILMDNWTDNSCQLHIGAETPMVFKHGLHKEAAQYIFGTAGRKMVLGFTPANNEKALRIDKHLGLKEIARVPDSFSDGVDYVVLCMRKEECTYFSED